MIKRVLLLIACFFTTIALAGTDGPVEMLEQTSQQMIAALKKNHEQIQKDPTVVYGMAEKIILPHVDITAMSKLALGREYWQQTNERQRKQFGAAFADLLIRTYSTALASYSNEQIRFKPLRGDASEHKRIQVDSVIYQKGGPAIPVSYRLFNKQGQWKVYDMTVDGVSMIQSFRSQFAATINQEGIDGLLIAMNKHATKGH